MTSYEVEGVRDTSQAEGTASIKTPGDEKTCAYVRNTWW